MNNDTHKDKFEIFEEIRNIFLYFSDIIFTSSTHVPSYCAKLTHS